MATEQYAQETLPYLKQNESSQEKWKSLSEAANEPENSPASGFDCNICLDSVQDPVVTLCGHLYCWPCIYKWIHHQTASSELPGHHNAQCPVCKHEISQKTIIPLYGRGQTTKTNSDDMAQDVGTTIPRRPPSPGCRATQQLNNLVHRQQAPSRMAMRNVIGPNMISPTSPTTGMFGEIVYERMFGNTQMALFAHPNSYNLEGISTQRARRHTMEVDRSLSRMCFFLFCCAMLCLIFF